MKNKFLPEIWQKILSVQVIDADGWDRSSPDAFATSWNTPITFEDFRERFRKSTTHLSVKNNWKDVDQKVEKYQRQFLQDRLSRLEDIYSELHDLANSLAGDDTGFIAATIHQASNALVDPKNYLRERITTGKTPEEAGIRALTIHAMRQFNDVAKQLDRRAEKCPDCGLPCNDPQCCYYDEELNK